MQFPKSRSSAGFAGVLSVLACGLLCAPAARAATYVFPVADSLPAEIREKLAPGDTLLVPPGIRRVNVVLAPGITIRGDGPADSIVFTPYLPTGATFAFQSGAEKTRIENLTFDMHLAPDATALYFSGNDVEVRGNRFIGGLGVRADSSSGLIAENRFDEPMKAIFCNLCQFWVDKNVIEGAKNGAISMRGSPLRITRNKIVRSVNTGILVSGKRYVPIIGGEPGMGNEIHGAFNSDLYTDSGAEINAQYNYWGIRTTEEMNRLGFPSNITAITDGWDQTKAAGQVDYRNWLQEPGGSPKAAGGGVTANRRAAGIVGAAVAIVLVVGLLIASRRRRANGAAAR